MTNYLTKLIVDIGPTLLSPLVVGYVLWKIGDRSEKKRLKADTIRELMGYRGDYGTVDFGRALNKVSVVFNEDNEIRLEVRKLYERINTEPNSIMTKRSIVGLIYKLCQKNGFRGLTEYDIDQAFPENKQVPQVTPDEKVILPNITHKKDSIKTNEKNNNSKKSKSQ